MVTILVILCLALMVCIGCLVGQHFRINQHEQAIARLSIGLMDMKLKLNEWELQPVHVNKHGVHIVASKPQDPE